MNIEESLFIATNENELTQKDNASDLEIKQASKPTEPVSRRKTYAVDELKAFLKELSVTYGLDHAKIYYTVDNESSFNPYAVEPTKRLSIGISQYTIGTWLEFCSTKDDRTDPYKSLECMAKMWSMGLEYRWDAYCLRYYDIKCIELRGIYPQ